MACVGKQLSAIKYEDLLISSKFFYTEGSEDADRIFPDETKQCRESGLDRHQESNFALVVPDQTLQHSARDAAKHSSETESRRMSRAVLNVDIAMEAACGDSTFLVSIKKMHLFTGIFQLHDMLIFTDRAREYCLQISKRPSKQDTSSQFARFWKTRHFP